MPRTVFRACRSRTSWCMYAEDGDIPPLHHLPHLQKYELSIRRNVPGNRSNIVIVGLSKPISDMRQRCSIAATMFSPTIGASHHIQGPVMYDDRQEWLEILAGEMSLPKRFASISDAGMQRQYGAILGIRAPGNTASTRWAHGTWHLLGRNQIWLQRHCRGAQNCCTAYAGCVNSHVEVQSTHVDLILYRVLREW
jgi:hypothetical protein